MGQSEQEPVAEITQDGKLKLLNASDLDFGTKLYTHPAPAVAVNEQDRLDAARYRWLFGARTEDECQNWKVGHLPLKPQDRVIGQVATVFMPKVAVDGEIDDAMEAEAEKAKGGV